MTSAYVVYAPHCDPHPKLIRILRNRCEARELVNKLNDWQSAMPRFETSGTAENCVLRASKNIHWENSCPVKYDAGLICGPKFAMEEVEFVE